MGNITLQLLRQKQTHRVLHGGEASVRGKQHSFDTDFRGILPQGGGAQVRHLWSHRTAVHVPTHSDSTSEKHLNVSLHGSKPLVIAGLSAIQTCTANDHPCLKAFKAQILQRFI